MPRTMQRITCSYFLFSFILLHSSCSAWVAITPRSCSTRGCPLLHSSTLQSQQKQQQQQRYPSLSSSCSSSSNTRLYATTPQQTNDNNSAAVKTKKQSRASLLDPETNSDDGETPAGIEGAQFFGGNKQKEEFFDPVAEAQATVETLRTTTTYARFQDQQAFTDDKVAAVAASLQEMFNQVLYEGTNNNNNNNNNISVKPEYKYAYDKNLIWKTPFPVQSTTTATNNPLTELESALGFYRRLDVAITSGETVRSGFHDDNNNNKKEEALESLYKIRWEISVAWPTFWEPRILLTGTSLLTVQDKNRIITSQVDELDGAGGSSSTSTTDSLFSAIVKQWVPRFWDFYHIGMTPSAELLPKIQSSSSFFSRYNRYEVPPRLYLQPRQLDLGTRIDANAAIVPNHAFSCVIKTMGPTRQRYIPCSPVQVQILPTTKQQQQNQLLLQWSIPIAVECMTNAELAIPGPDEEALPESEPTCEYVFQPRRSVATLNYGGNPQDVAIADIRKKLYDLVIKDGLKPKLDDNGRPIFFFWQNTVKACYTDEGLGMVVYEWRPQFAKSNEVGIELEVGNSSK